MKSNVKKQRYRNLQLEDAIDLSLFVLVNLNTVKLILFLQERSLELFFKYS